MLTNRQLFLQHIAQTSDAPLALEIVKAEGMYLTDADGRKYMDLISGISVSNLGHCHPRVVEAVQTQAATYMHTLVYGEFVLSPQVKLAEYLCSLLPKNLNSVYFTNSGAEATEGAMKLAKRYTGSTEIISCIHSYHGSTQGALSMLGDEYFKSAFRPLLPDTRLIRYNSEEDLSFITERTAAVFIEPVQAEAGILVPDKFYLQKVRQRCNETGTLLVFDEIQTGCGRTGTLFRFEKEQVIPDILLLAKGFGGGMPIGCFIADQSIMSSLSYQPVLGHITTFGGNAVCCAAALASLKTICEEKLFAYVAEKEDLFVSLLQHRAIKKVTHCGLMLAVHLDNYENLRKVIQLCIENGVITDWFLFCDNALRIAPPLIISEQEIRQACGIILRVLDVVYRL